MVVAGLSLPIHLLNLLQPPKGSEGCAAMQAAAAYLERQSAGSEGVRPRIAFEDQENQDKTRAESRAKAESKPTAVDQHVLPH